MASSFYSTNFYHFQGLSFLLPALPDSALDVLGVRAHALAFGAVSCSVILGMPCQISLLRIISAALLTFF